MPSERPRRGRTRRRLVAVLIVAALGILALILLLVAASFRERPPATSVAGPVAAAAATRAWLGAIDHAGPPAVPPAPARQTLLQAYQLAEQTLCSYLDASQYPPGSRPMAQNADQAYPNRPVTEANSMRLDGGGTDSQVILQTAQSRVHLASGEGVTFTLHAIDPNGVMLPLVVTQAVAAGIRYGAARAQAPVALAFADDGAGTWSGVLAPAQTGLAGFDGTIRTQVAYSVNGKAGQVAFDVVYSPVLPAVWNGPAREAVENGALVFYLHADVRTAGRYIVTGRVDDAHGTPFALLTFNDLLPAGPNDIRLIAFGKLLRDGAPAQPLVLRDVDGYLLRENTDPDRALMPRLEGPVATSRNYPLNTFSDTPYAGEERTRYLAEFGKDVRLARDALRRADPSAVLPPSACAPAVGAEPAR